MTVFQTQPSEGKVLNALILDDDDFDRRRISRMTASCGLDMTLVAVPTIDDMCDVMDDQVFDLFFIDYRLGRGTGLDALAHIRERQQQALSAKIMLTGYRQIDVAVMALKNGCHDYLDKDDLTPDFLRQTVETVMGKLRPSEIRPTFEPTDLDAALLRMAQTQLPQLVAQIFSSEPVQDVMRPALRTVIQDSLFDVLQRYDLPPNVLSQPEVKNLIASISSDHQVRF